MRKKCPYKKLFILYDGRAHHDEDDAAVLCTAFSEKEAKEDLELFPQDSLWFEYDIIDGYKAENGKARYDLRGSQ